MLTEFQTFLEDAPYRASQYHIDSHKREIATKLFKRIDPRLT